MGVSRAYKVGSPYNGSELSDLSYDQTTDTMYLAHINKPPYKLVRNDHDDWLYSAVAIGPVLDAPTSLSAVASNPNTDADNGGDAYFPQSASYVVTSVSDETGQESRATAASTATNDLSLKRNYNTIAWTAEADADRYNVYKADNSQFFGYIGTTDSVTFRDDNIGPALDRAPPEGYNPFADGEGYYPSTVKLHNQRLLYARTLLAPNAIWGSRVGVNELENFDKSSPLRPDDSLSFSIIAGQVNAVEALAGTTSLFALTTGSIFTIDGDGNGSALSATSQAAKRQIGRGSSRLRPQVIDNVIFYVPSTGDSVRTISYSFEYEGQTSNDVTIYSPHFFEGFDIIDWCYAQEPRSVVWAVRSDGALLAFTWEQEQNVWGWTLCETDGVVKAVATINEGGEDRLWILVERQIGEVTKTFVERMASHLWDSVENTCFMDSAVSASFDEPQSTASGLWHLEGRTDVVGIVDGVAVEGLTVTNGGVTLPENIGTGSVMTFGLPYQVDIGTLPVRFNQQGKGFNVGRKQQTGQIALTLDNSRSVYHSVDGVQYDLLKGRTSEAYGAPDKLLSGDFIVDSANHVSGDCEVQLRQTSPLPLTVLGIFLEPNVAD